MEGKKPRRAKVRRFTEPRRAAFLEVLRRTGNVAASIKAIGMERTCVEKRRARDAAFAIAFAAALAEASARLAGAGDPREGVANADFESIKRGKGGRYQIVASRTGKWNKSKEEMFLGALRGCGNVAASARSVGFSESLIWQRRRKWPGFAARIEEALEEAELAIKFRLACIGNNVGAGVEGEQSGFAPIEGAQPPPAPNPSLEGRGGIVPFDPEFALRFLKWREEKRRGREPRGRRGHIPRVPDIEEVKDNILRKLAAIRAHRAISKAAEDAQTDRDG